MRLSNQIVIKRCLATRNVFETLADLARVVRLCQERFHAPPTLIIVRDKPPGVGPKSRIKYTNICGKIDHVTNRPIHHPGVQPLVKVVSNGFGRFRGLYSRHCNLLTCTTQSSTLFRGGRSSKGVDKAVLHAMNPDNIYRMTVHMLVAHARLGHGVCVDSHYLDQHVSQDSRWTCVSMAQHEEMAYVKSLRLTNFSAEFVSAMKIQAPETVVLSVSKNGSVNFFVTMASDVKFERNIEHRYTPFLQALVDVVREGS